MAELVQEIKQFLDGNIDSVDQLEILRILAANPGRGWEAPALAQELHLSANALSAHLDVLIHRGLLTPLDSLVYRHGPRNPEIAGPLNRLLECYRERPVSVIRAVYAKRKSP